MGDQPEMSTAEFRERLREQKKRRTRVQKIPQDLWRQIIEPYPENEQCADCRNPRIAWACYDRGIVICRNLRCSKLKNLHQENFPPTAIQIIQSVGNKTNNEIYEPEDLDPAMVPSPSDESHIKERWIRNKYIEKKYVDPPPVSQQKLNKAFWNQFNKMKAKPEWPPEFFPRIVFMLAQGADIDATFDEKPIIALVREAIANGSKLGPTMERLLLLLGANDPKAADVEMEIEKEQMELAAAHAKEEEPEHPIEAKEAEPPADAPTEGDLSPKPAKPKSKRSIKNQFNSADASTPKQQPMQKVPHGDAKKQHAQLKKDLAAQKKALEDIPSIYPNEDDIKPLYYQFEKTKLQSMKHPEPIAFTTGPYTPSAPSGAMRHLIHGASITTYPHPPGTGQLGDPICDSYILEAYQNGALVAVLTDGCGWGGPSRDAAAAAKVAFLDYMRSRMEHIHHVQDAAKECLGALSAAQWGIIKDTPPMERAGLGTTTLMGGLLAKVDKDTWNFTAVSVGDCKGYLYHAADGTFTDITAGNRQNLNDPRDPGGRLGAYLDGAPDLRNLETYSVNCKEGDIFMLCSDGVHDNLDPQGLGYTPKELDPDLSFDDWAALDAYNAKKAGITDEERDRVETLKTAFMEKTLKQIAFAYNEGGPQAKLTPQSISAASLEHARANTANLRAFMESHPRDRQPKEPAKFYTGKVDHTTCLAWEIADYQKFYNPELELQATKGLLRSAKVTMVVDGRPKAFQFYCFTDHVAYGEKTKKEVIWHSLKIPYNLVWIELEDDPTKLVVVGPYVEWDLEFSSASERSEMVEELRAAAKAFTKDKNFELDVELNPDRQATFLFSSMVGQSQDSSGYSGSWTQGHFQGEGSLEFSGHWSAELKAGFGKIKDKKTGKEQTGGWLNNMASEGLVVVADTRNASVHDELTSADLDLLRTGATVTTFADRDVIIKEGRTNNNLYLVKAGRVNIVKGEQQLTSFSTGALFGEMSVLDTSSRATANVVAAGQCVCEVIETGLVYELFKLHPDFSWRFHKMLAWKLLKRILDLEGNKKVSNVDSALFRTQGKLVPDAPSQVEEKNPLAALDIEGLENETLVTSYKAQLAKKLNFSKFKKSGVLYLTANIAVFHTRAFGRDSVEKFLYSQISEPRLEDDRALTLVRGSKPVYVQFENSEETQPAYQLVKSLWQAAMKRKGKPASPALARPSRSLSSKAMAAKGESLRKHDWELILNGSESKVFKQGEIVVEEGTVAGKLYFIKRGRCRIEVSGKNVGVMEKEETFGEISFLQGGKATASVVADSQKTEVQWIEDSYLNILFVRYPQVAGRFFHYIAKILEGRLRLRESTKFEGSDTPAQASAKKKEKK